MIAVFGRHFDLTGAPYFSGHFDLAGFWYLRWLRFAHGSGPFGEREGSGIFAFGAAATPTIIAVSFRIPMAKNANYPHIIVTRLLKIFTSSIFSNAPPKS